jgi:hypothetical protein
MTLHKFVLCDVKKAQLVEERDEVFDLTITWFDRNCMSTTWNSATKPVNSGISDGKICGVVSATLQGLVIETPGPWSHNSDSHKEPGFACMLFSLPAGIQHEGARPTLKHRVAPAVLACDL